MFSFSKYEVLKHGREQESILMSFLFLGQYSVIVVTFPPDFVYVYGFREMVFGMHRVGNYCGMKVLFCFAS